MSQVRADDARSSLPCELLMWMMRGQLLIKCMLKTLKKLSESVEQRGKEGETEKLNNCCATPGAVGFVGQVNCRQGQRQRLEVHPCLCPLSLSCTL